MARLSFSAAHLPVHQSRRGLLPFGSIDNSQFDCTDLIDQRTIDNQMVEAMNTKIGRLLVEAGLATRTPDGRLDYRPEAANTVVVIAGGNGSYFSTVRSPFDPERGKGTMYQTGVWVPSIEARPPVDQAIVGTEVRHMVNAAMEVFQLFGEVAGIDVRQVVPRSHAVDARPCHPI